MDPYETLGVRPGAAPEHIRQRYKEMVLKYHPDRNSAPEAVQMFQDVVDAYQQIMEDPTQGGNIKVQSAKYTRKNPKKPGRAARQQARRQSGHKQKAKCQKCNGLGVIVQTKRVWRFMRAQDTRFCDACGGRGRTQS